VYEAKAYGCHPVLAKDLTPIQKYLARRFTQRIFFQINTNEQFIPQHEQAQLIEKCTVHL